MEANEIVIRYLQDAEAAERTFEDALAAFSKSGEQGPVQSLMSWMSEKAKSQHERLEARLAAYGAERSAMKSWLAHAIAFTPTSAQLGHTPDEKSTQHLMITYAAAAAEMAMYESLASVSEALGDLETAHLARQLQQEEQEDHVMAWQQLGPSAREAFRRTVNT
jgi:ferritin-like metal-binding protein YciE